VDHLVDLLSAWKPFSALVVGDFMLDQLQYGDADRLSADAPVPVLHVTRTEDRPGGAANVCLDLIAMRGSVRAIGVIGGDGEGEALRRALEREGVRADALAVDASRPTTVKRSLIGLAQGRHPQKMFRVDYESRHAIPSHIEDELLRSVARALPEIDVVCIEDYNKGVCTERLCQGVIDLANKAGKPVFVDPARLDDYAKYRRATAITPNRTEAEVATRMETARDASLVHNSKLAHALMAQLDVEAVVLTLDKHGALLLERDGLPIGIPTVAREVYDVTGAGDMMLAALAAARANDFSWDDSVRFANAAAGLEVEQFGVVPIPLELIHHELMERAGIARGKLRTLDQVLVQVQALRSGTGRASNAKPRRVVFTNGCFDVIHAGHVSLLEQAANEGDFLIVGLNSDASVKRLKGPERPINCEEDRARVLGEMRSVDAVVVFGEDTPMRLIEAIRPDVLVKGADYSKDKVVGGSFVEEYGGRIALIELVKGKSTTGLITKMRK
jgi:D-beta-D-heptose 7-phosphate kinase/D-beta-D-heptose 1-phosphate adenosyltransferase